jgi:hypothetical protein
METVAGTSAIDGRSTNGRGGQRRTAPRFARGVATFSTVDLALAFVGMVLLAIAYGSLLPSVAGGMFFVCGAGIVVFSYGAKSWELRAFTRLFAAGWVAAGFAGIFAEHLGDAGQLASDAADFYEAASGAFAGMSIEEIRVQSEGALAIAAWRLVYDAFSAIGFPRDRYVGVLGNVLAVALTGVVAVRIARLVYGADANRFRRLILMMSCCGLLWLFAGIHLRDSVVLLLVTALAWLWVSFLQRPGFGVRLLLLIAVSVALAIPLAFVRGEFVFVPFAFALAGVASLAVARGFSMGRLVLLAGGLALVLAVGSILGEDLGSTLERGTEGYIELARESSTSGSLGTALVVNQPLPVRVVVGSVYLFVFPLPMWSGLVSSSAYHWFKSFNVILLYSVVPLLALAVRLILSDKQNRRAPLIFLLFVVVGMTMAIALTSLETRHWGAFLVPLFVVALLPSLSNVTERRQFQRLLVLQLFGVAAMHVAWFMLKH